MFAPMYNELIGYSAALVCMQRLESRHSVLKRMLSFRLRQNPATLSASIRRRQNRDLEQPKFQQNLVEYLSSIGELYQGQWSCKTQLLAQVGKESAMAEHAPLTDLRQKKEAFAESLALLCRGEAQADDQLAIMREHVKATLFKGQCYALRGMLKPCTWTYFRMLSTNPGSIMTLQRACHLASDAWQQCVAIEVLTGSVEDETSERPAIKVYVTDQSVMSVPMSEMFKPECDMQCLHTFTEVVSRCCFCNSFLDEMLGDIEDQRALPDEDTLSAIKAVASAAISGGCTVREVSTNDVAHEAAIEWMTQQSIVNQNGFLDDAFVTVATHLAKPIAADVSDSRFAICKYLLQNGWKPAESAGAASLATKTFNAAAPLEYFLLLRHYDGLLLRYDDTFGFRHTQLKSFYDALLASFKRERAEEDDLDYVASNQKADFYKSLSDFFAGRSADDPRAVAGLLHPKSRTRGPNKPKPKSSATAPPPPAPALIQVAMPQQIPSAVPGPSAEEPPDPEPEERMRVLCEQLPTLTAAAPSGGDVPDAEDEQELMGESVQDDRGQRDQEGQDDFAGQSATYQHVHKNRDLFWDVEQLSRQKALDVCAELGRSYHRIDPGTRVARLCELLDILADIFASGNADTPEKQVNKALDIMDRRGRRCQKCRKVGYADECVFGDIMDMVPPEVAEAMLGALRDDGLATRRLSLQFNRRLNYDEVAELLFPDDVLPFPGNGSQLTVCVAGSPCPDWSKFGKRAGDSGDSSASEDENSVDNGKNLCCHCLQVVTAVEAVVRGRAWACKRCNGARVALERHYKETNRMHLWMHMGREEKNNVIISNKFKSQGQGKKFPIKIAEEVVKEDSMELNQQKNWVNKLQFRREAKKRWGMNKAQAKAKWQDFLADPKMPKGRDQMNWVTMTKGARNLKHTQAMKKTEIKNVTDDDLFDMAHSGMDQGTLHRDTSIFDRMQDFLESSCLEMGMAVKTGKAKAKPKSKALGAKRRPGDGLEADQRPKKHRNQDAQRDVDRIAALRQRRNLCDSLAALRMRYRMVNKLLDFFKEAGPALATSAEPAFIAVDDNASLLQGQIVRMVLNLPEQDAGDLLDGIANKPEELEDDTCSHETAQAMHKAVNMVLDVMEAGKTGKKQDLHLYEKNINQLISACYVGDAEAAEKGDDSQLEGDGDENGESEEEKEDDPAVLPLQGPLHLPQEAAGYESPQGWHVLATGVSRLGDVKNAIRFVSVPGREVPTLQELRAWVGPFLFDGPIKIETEKDYANVMQEFEHFASSGSDQKLLTEHLTKMDIKGPRPKELLFEKDLGTGPGASLLMESFRIAEEFKVQDLRSQGDCTDEEVFKRLFCLRFNRARPLHHMVGVNECMLGRTVSVMSGCRFICGVGFADLADYDEKFCANNNPDAGPSFVRVCERLVQLDASALFDLSGWVVVLKPGQALQIPPGHLTAETNMTETSAMAGWSSVPLRYPHVDMVLDWDRHLTSALHLLQCDISSGRFDNNRHLNSCQKHLSLGKTQLLPWVSKMGMTVEPSVTPENDKPTMQQQQRLLVVKQEEGADTSRDMGERTSAAENASDDEEVIFVSESLAQDSEPKLPDTQDAQAEDQLVDEDPEPKLPDTQDGLATRAKDSEPKLLDTQVVAVKDPEPKLPDTQDAAEDSEKVPDTQVEEGVQDPEQKLPDTQVAAEAKAQQADEKEATLALPRTEAGSGDRGLPRPLATVPNGPCEATKALHEMKQQLAMKSYAQSTPSSCPGGQMEQLTPSSAKKMDPVHIHDDDDDEGEDSERTVRRARSRGRGRGRAAKAKAAERAKGSKATAKARTKPAAKAKK
ncbi:unnamed protein product [Symbiodinium necroappetens]|uniref:Uncharacterized protein n=1 Tax=Symbiodinium necroappetens TaxID=1628268 RepID=A0A812L0I6_9DINO|nr:unnamed protein product [Symbiodinium necroappetens]